MSDFTADQDDKTGLKKGKGSDGRAKEGKVAGTDNYGEGGPQTKGNGPGRSSGTEHLPDGPNGATSQTIGHQNGANASGADANEKQPNSPTGGRHGKNLVVTASGLNVRSSPGTESKANIIGVVHHGHRLQGIAREGAWIRISYRGQTAYVHSAHVEAAPPRVAPEVAAQADHAVAAVRAHAAADTIAEKTVAETKAAKPKPATAPTPTAPSARPSPPAPEAAAPATEAPEHAAPTVAHAAPTVAHAAPTAAHAAPTAAHAAPAAAAHPAPTAAHAAPVAGADHAAPAANASPAGADTGAVAVRLQYNLILMQVDQGALTSEHAMDQFIAFDKTLHGGKMSSTGLELLASLPFVLEEHRQARLHAHPTTGNAAAPANAATNTAQAPGTLASVEDHGSTRKENLLRPEEIFRDIPQNNVKKKHAFNDLNKAMQARQAAQARVDAAKTSTARDAAQHALTVAQAQVSTATEHLKEFIVDSRSASFERHDPDVQAAERALAQANKAHDAAQVTKAKADLALAKAAARTKLRAEVDAMKHTEAGHENESVFDTQETQVGLHDFTFTDGQHVKVRDHVVTYATNAALGVDTDAMETRKEKEQSRTEVQTGIDTAGISSSRAKILKAISGFEGGFHTLNTYDRGGVTWGFVQWTAPDGTGDLTEALAIIKKEYPDAFARQFQAYGIDIDAKNRLMITPPGGAPLVGQPAVDALKQNPRLAAALSHAGYDKDVQKGEVKAADKLEIDAALNLSITAAKHPALRASQLITSEYGVGVLANTFVHSGSGAARTHASAALTAYVAKHGYHPEDATWAAGAEDAVVAGLAAIDSDRSAQLAKILATGRGTFVSAGVVTASHANPTAPPSTSAPASAPAHANAPTAHAETTSAVQQTSHTPAPAAASSASHAPAHAHHEESDHQSNTPLGPFFGSPPPGHSAAPAGGSNPLATAHPGMPSPTSLPGPHAAGPAPHPAGPTQASPQPAHAPASHQTTSTTTAVSATTFKTMKNGKEIAVTTKEEATVLAAIRKNDKRIDPKWLMAAQLKLQVDDATGAMNTETLRAFRDHAKNPKLGARAILNEAFLKGIHDEGKPLVDITGPTKTNTQEESETETAADLTVKEFGFSSYANYKDQWVKAEFLDHTFENKVHKYLAERLKLADAFVRQLHPGKKDKELRDAVGWSGKGNSSYDIDDGAVGGPLHQTHQHTMGLAIDIDPAQNPWMLGVHINSQTKANTALINKFWQPIFAIAAKMYGGEAMTIETLNTWSEQHSTEELWEKVDAQNQAFGNLRALIRNNPRAEVERQVVEKGKYTADEAKEFYDKYFSLLEEYWGPDAKTKGAKPKMGRTQDTKSFTNHSKEMVVALRDVAGLAWGGSELSSGENGDFMHFDCRHTDFGSSMYTRAKHHHDAKMAADQAKAKSKKK